MKVKLVIPGRLDDLNRYTRACRSNPHAGAEMKKDNEAVCAACIRQQLTDVKLTGMASIRFIWLEKDNRRDPDNVSAFGRKVILDALVRCGVLVDDSRKYIHDFTDIFTTDKNDPRIEVTIWEEEA